MTEQPKREPDTDRRERLAAYAHDAWSGWMRYLFNICVDHDGEIVIPQWAVERWTRQMTTAYQDLPEGEKASDRAEADKMLAITDADNARLRAALEELKLRYSDTPKRYKWSLRLINEALRAPEAGEAPKEDKEKC